MAIFEQYPAASFAAGGVTVAFPVSDIQEDGGNRIVERERPYREGAKLDDTGAKAKRWVLTCCFENTIVEPGVDDANGGDPLYPDVMNSLIDLFEIHETGDLVVPTRGRIRARAESYSRSEGSTDKRDSATLTLTFVEDNEDNVGPQSFSAPTAEANARRLKEQTTFDSESAGMGDPSLEDLEDADLEDATTSPFDTVSDIDTEVRKVEDATSQVKRTYDEPESLGRDALTDAGADQTARKIERQVDMASRSKKRPETTTVTYQRDKTFLGISADEDVAVESLYTLNPELDPEFVPARTPVRLPAS
jgi:hypothetical protein